MTAVLVSLLTLFSPTQLGKHFWPSYSYLSGFKLDYLSPTFYFTDLLLILLLIFNFKSLLNQTKKLSLFLKISLISLPLLNIFFAINPLPALIFWLRILLLVNFTLSLVTRPFLLKLIYYSLFSALIFTSLLTIAQFLLQSSLNGPLYFLGERQLSVATAGIARLDLTQHLPYSLFSSSTLLLRPYATFSHPNSLAGFLLLSQALLYLLYQHLNLQKLSLILASVVALPALFLTFSRTASLTALLILPLLVISPKLPSSIKKITVFSIPVFVLLFSLLFIFPSLTSLPSASLAIQSRLFLNHSAVKIFTRHPLLGTGLNNFLYALINVSPQTPFSLIQPAHSLFWLTLSQLGLVIFAPLIYLFLRFYFNLSFRSQLIMAIVILTGLLDHYWLTLPQNRLLFALAISLLITLKNKQNLV